MSTMLLDSPEINAIESRFISLYDRTLKRGIQGKPTTLKQTLKKQFQSYTFKIQLDKILDDLVLFTIKYTDSLINEQLTAALRDKQKPLKLIASKEVLPLTEEAVRQSIELSEGVAESIIRTLKEEGIYQENPRVLARRMLDLWGGERYRAERFARTFSADVATSTTLHRYKQQGIEECQFYATIDGRTSPQCRMLHGTVYTVGSPESRAYVPPCHPHCRSVILPLPVTVDVDDSLRYENRNFEKPVSQNFKPLKDELDKDLVNGTFKNIDKFNDNYRIDKFILDEDLEKRLMRLGVGIEGEVPMVKVPKAKTPKTKKLTKDEVLNNLENEIRHRTLADGEKCYLVDKNGNILTTKTGAERSIEFTDEETKIFKGNYFTHSHPSGQSFSPDDIRTACNTGLKEIRAAGKYRTYILKQADGNNFTPETWKNIKRVSKDTNYDVRDDFTPLIKNGELSIERANALHWHEVWTRVFKRRDNIEYSFIEVGELPK